jgi:D-aminopeptidase
LHDRIFERIGMNSAFLAANTRAMPDGTEGYEGTQTSGFRVADNNILWTGDAGLGASLDDMIAWEKHIDATRDDTSALYNRISTPVHFRDGKEATYGFGLGRGTVLGRPVTAHGGGLRGWRSHRLYARSERISVVVMFNHLSEAHAAASALFAATLDEDLPQTARASTMPDWLGAYVEPETGIVARIDAAADGRVQLRYGHSPEQLDLQADGTAQGGSTRLRLEQDGVWMDRGAENHSSRLRPCVGVAAKDIAGRFRCEELNAELTIFDAGGALYGGFSGFLGQGRLELLDPVGPDVWTLPCHRALDYTAPGDWSLVFRRDANGRIDGVEVGCWLARRLLYTRVE